ncbi:MAG: polyribonucleotide nucleotidyltransferase [Parachlamydiales bacterium]|nr:polyribonucleotide nucleotidyltransferase [Parachlamydiales bacterium]
MKPKSLTISLENFQLVFETGLVAKQANGSIMLHCGDTTILATACASPSSSDETDFFPLRVDYQEKFSSAGKTLGGFIKREGRPQISDILVSRFIDRSIRPLFPDGYYNEVQILSSVYSYDAEYQPDVLSICAASAALLLSDIPFTKAVGAVRVGLIDGKFIVNPSIKDLERSELDLVLAGTEDSILMIEGFSNFLTEEQILEAIDFGHHAIKTICHHLLSWQKEIGKEKNNDSVLPISGEVKEAVAKIAKKELEKALKISTKKDRENLFKDIFAKVEKELLDEIAPKYLRRDVNLAYKNLSSEIMRKNILQDNIRIDGRKLEEIRPISCIPSFLKRTHGSALFTRGETQALAVCTLGGETMAQRYEDLHGSSAHRFYLQYFFPPFSVGEVGKGGAPGRREIGHGKLAERALAQSLPAQETFPYVIRLESNITESNGSSSMASVCGGCLALMDAGVPIVRPVSGIAMGLILEEEQYVILSDILGTEDALGDMDFKVTGDKDGITAFQMDIKVEGITPEIMKKALEQAKKGRQHILQEMLKCLPTHRETLSAYAPRITSLQVKPSKIGTIIGPGGKQIREIIEKTGSEIDISDEGIVNIVSLTAESMELAKEMIESLIAEVEVGKTYNGKITSIKPFGLFVELIKGQEGLCHVSEVSFKRIENLEDYYKVGDKIEVIVLEINDRGQVRLSHKALLKKE